MKCELPRKRGRSLTARPIRTRHNPIACVPCPSGLRQVHIDPACPRNSFAQALRRLHHLVVTFDPVAVANELVRARFPMARAAWLGGSAATNTMTATSDLDVTVLLPGEPEPFRESAIVDSRPVELFVHTEASIEHFVAQDLQRRRPTLLRLVGTSVVLIDVDGVGRRLQERCHRLDVHGPPRLPSEAIDAARYAVTDLLDDIVVAGSEMLSVAAALWQQTADLVLGANARWSGTGKWLLRELQAFDATAGTAYAADLMGGLAAAAHGDGAPLCAAVDSALDPLGGRLFDGFRREGAAPGLRLRPARSADEPFIVDMARYACVIEDWPLPDPDDDEVRGMLPRAGATAIIAEDGVAGPVGAVWTWHNDPPLRLDAAGHSVPELCIGVVPGRRGTGIGSALLDALFSECAVTTDALCANVHARNPAQRLYLRKGFTMVGQGRGQLGRAMHKSLR